MFQCYLPLPSATFRYLPLPSATFRYRKQPNTKMMTKTKDEAFVNDQGIFAKFVNCKYHKVAPTIMKTEAVIASSGTLKWACNSKAITCSHAVPDPEPRAKFADYLVPSTATPPTEGDE